MSPYEYLRKNPEPMPQWLARFRQGQGFNRADFFASRVVYYPGAGFDGDPVKLFGSTGSAHTFILVDYSPDRGAVESALADPVHGFLGYRKIGRIEVPQAALTPGHWSPRATAEEMRTAQPPMPPPAPFAFVEVLERMPDRPADHGPVRLAILLLGADGIAAYDALFCQPDIPRRPFAVVLHDHGWGLQYENFGRDGLLERIASRSSVFPHLQLVAENTRAWEGFTRVPDVDGDPQGMHRTLRFLFERNSARL